MLAKSLSATLFTRGSVRFVSSESRFIGIHFFTFSFLFAGCACGFFFFAALPGAFWPPAQGDGVQRFALNSRTFSRSATRSRRRMPGQDLFGIAAWNGLLKTHWVGGYL